MELKLKDLLEAITFKPFADMTELCTEVVKADGTCTVFFGVEAVVKSFGEAVVSACEIKGYNYMIVYIKEVIA